jgi:hypothetical protein
LFEDFLDDFSGRMHEGLGRLQVFVVGVLNLIDRSARVRVAVEANRVALLLAELFLNWDIEQFSLHFQLRDFNGSERRLTNAAL